MALTADQQAALDRMLTYYDGDAPYNPATNPGGFRQGGQVVNFEPALKDTANVVKGAGSLIADALAAATNSPKAVRVDSQQSFSNAEVVQALKNIGLLGNGYTLTAAQMDQIRLFIGGAAPASVSGTGTATLSLLDIERDIYATGTPTIVAANGGAGWRSGVITNDNPATGLVTLKVPASATLDGVQDGVTLLFPKQRARIRQTGATSYRTEWMDRTPMLSVSEVKSNSPVASVDIAIPDGYNYLRLVVSELNPVNDGANLNYRVSYDGSSFRTDGQYAYVFVAGSSSASGSSSGGVTLGYFSASGISISNANYQQYMSDAIIAPGGGPLGVRGRHFSMLNRSNQLNTQPAFTQENTGSSYYGAENQRAKVLRIFMNAGNIASGRFSLQGWV